MQHRQAIEALHRETEKARKALASERAASLAAAPAALVFAWLIACLLGVQERLPALAGAIGTLGALVVIGLVCRKAMLRWRRPSTGEARARLAADNHFDPGLVDTLEDSPTRLDPVSLALWSREQARAGEALSKVAARQAQIDLKRLDPFGLRYMLPIAFAGALIVAGPYAGDRILGAFAPDPGPLLGDRPMEIEAWLTPASYTEERPVSLSDRVGQIVEVGPSPEATVRVAGPVGAPWLIYEPSSGPRKKVQFTRAADGAYEAKLSLAGPGQLRIVRFRTKARWRVAPGKDAAPKAALTGAPQVGSDGRVTVRWSATDDYGVRGLALRLTPVRPPAGLRNAPPIDTPLESPAGEPKSATGEATVDLYDHPYAGMKVEAQIVAIDAQGQRGVSSAALMSAPEMVFLQPIARAAVEIRKVILHERRAYAEAPAVLTPIIHGDDHSGALLTDDKDPRLERAPKAIKRAGQMLDALTAEPGDGYFRDTAVYAGLRFARFTLNYARSIDQTNGAAEILWEVAKRAEFGDAADAKRALEMAQRAFEDALQRGASPEELQRLAQALQRATDNYLQALIQDALRQNRQAENQEDTAQEQRQMSMQDLQSMLDEIRRRAESGDAAGAQALLQQLAQMLDKLEVRLAEGSGEGMDGEQSPELEQAIEQLSQQIGRQRALRDETQQQESGEEQGDQPSAQELAQRQSELAQELGKAQNTAKGAGAEGGQEDLNAAGQAMRRAEDALRKGDFRGAGRAQEEALRNLRNGAQQMARSADAKRQAGSREGESKGGARDPLGRPLAGAADDGSGDAVVPVEVQRERAREIFDELRRRAEDTRRPEAEREYLKRLLDRFTGT